MQNSNAMGLVWKIALIEAVGSRNEEIFPEHFMCALLKFVELNRPKIESLVSERNEKMEGILKEQEKVNQILKALKIDTTQVRRSLRGKVPRGQLEKINNVIRRTSESREIFLKATEIAERRKSSLLRSYDLLQALIENPTACMKTEMALDEETLESLPTPQETPLLNRLGKHIVEDSQLKQVDHPQLLPQIKALAKHLQSKNPDPLLLISPQKELTEDVIRKTFLAHKEILVGPVIGLDFHTLSEQSEENHLLQTLNKIFEEAFQSQSIVLFLENFDVGIRDNESFRRGFFSTIAGQTPPLIIGVSEENYLKLFEQETATRKCRVMWLHELTQGDDVPLEL